MTRKPQSVKLVQTTPREKPSAAPEYPPVESHPPRKWELDLRVPLATIIVLVVQTVGVIWWAADASGRLSRAEADIAALSDVDERLVRIETISEQDHATLGRIEDRLNDRR